MFGFTKQYKAIIFQQPKNNLSSNNFEDQYNSLTEIIKKETHDLHLKLKNEIYKIIQINNDKSKKMYKSLE